MEDGKKIETSTGSTVQKLSVVLTTNLSNVQCMTVPKHKTIAIHMCVDASKNHKWKASEKSDLFTITSQVNRRRRNPAKKRATKVRGSLDRCQMLQLRSSLKHFMSQINLI